MEDWPYWEEGVPPGLASWLFIVYFAIYKVKEGTKDENNLYNKNILNV